MPHKSARWCGAIPVTSLRTFAAILTLQFCGISFASSGETKTVLIINPAEVLSPSAQMIDRAMYEVFAESQQKMAILSEYLTSHTNPPNEVEIAALALIEKRYRGRHIDLVIARGERALDFVERHAEQLWPGTPTMYFSVSDASIYWRERPQQRSGVFIGHDYAGNLSLILQLQPTVKRVIQLVETPRLQEMQSMHAELTSVAKSLNPALKIETLPKNALPELLLYGATLPKDTALLAMTIDGDRDGVLYSTADILKAISTTANAPLYGMRGSYIGNDVVGGQVIDLTEHGRQSARLVLHLLTQPDTAPIVQVTSKTRCAVDDRQIQRWALSAQNIPAACERPFYTPLFWDRHKIQIMTFAAVSFIFVALFWGLYWQRKGRLKANQETIRQRTALAHVARLGSVGELTASIVHEINQPLGAILANADAATMMLSQQTSPDCELKAILTDIRNDNLRASEIIKKLRTLLTKRSLEANPVSLNDVIEACRSLLGNLAIRHHATIQIELAENLPLIMGDATHLQQILINLASNAMEAMDALPPAQRILSLRSDINDSGLVRLSVSDRGPGIPENVLPNIFDSFYTTKPEGMGMGLAIVQTIVEAHSGFIGVLNNEEGGTTFMVKFPQAC